MKVYVVIDSGGYEGEHDVIVVGVYSTMEKAKEKFAERVNMTKDDMNDKWEFEETETDFWSEELYRCSRNWNHIWIEEREVV